MDLSTPRDANKQREFNSLANDQKEAVRKIEIFLKSSDLEFNLSGYAGTGKTHLLKYLVDRVVRVNFCPTAPTHKAVRVIEKILKRKGKTLQSLHGLRPNTDISNFDIANPQFDPNGVEYIKNFGLIIIDECSQINSGIFDLNHQRAKIYNTKILYVGDDAQLPPINEIISKSFKVSNSFKLTEIIRQEVGNPLLELFAYIRKDISNSGDGNEFLKHLFTERSNIKGDIGYIVIPETIFKKEISKVFLDHKFEHNVDFVRHLSWTNESVSIWNQFIRNTLFNKPKEILIKDDLLTAYTTFLDEFNNPVIINSEDYIIDSIRDYVNNYGIKTFAINLISLHDKRNTSVLQIVDHTDKKSFKTYYNILNYLHLKAITATASTRKKEWYKFFKFRNSVLTMISFNLSEDNNKALVKKDIDYGYAMTIHKSQGSTFENVTIDLDNILYFNAGGKKYPVKDSILRNKLIYVAMSRAKNKVIMKI